MSDNTKLDWPRYNVGPRECMFVLGVIGVNYAHLEFALAAMFATVTGMGMDTVGPLLPKIRNNVRLDLMRERLPGHRWPEEVIEHVRHFINGFNVCADNRNLLMHSNIFTLSTDEIILFKNSNSGKGITCNPTLAELRQVADDMHTFFGYGLALSNAINWNLIAPKPHPSPLPWPDKPTSPNRLNYTGDSRTIQPMYQDRT
jgi:hypothetical protein